MNYCHLIKSTGPFAIGFFLLIALSSCSHIDFNSLTDDQLFQVAKDKFDRGKYRSARESLIAFKNRFPDSKHMAMTRLMLGDSHFFEKNFTEGLVQYEIYLKYHPADSKADYAHFQIAHCKKIDKNRYDRDQEPTRLAISAFKQVISKYPNSNYAVDARDEIDELRFLLAKHELYVGKYYLKIKVYRSAIHRFEGMLRDYANLGLDTEGLYNLINANIAEDNLTEARSLYQNLVSGYKMDKWIQKTEKEFGKLFNTLTTDPVEVEKKIESK